MSVNWDNVERVLDAIDAQPDRLSMASYESACGTTRCIAGWAAHLAGWSIVQHTGIATKDGESAYGHIDDIASDFLGIDARINSIGNGYSRIFSMSAFSTNTPSTDEIRARLKEFDS